MYKYTCNTLDETQKDFQTDRNYHSLSHCAPVGTKMYDWWTAPCKRWNWQYWHTRRYQVQFSNRGIISYYISIFQERIISPVKSELYVIQERIMDGSDWLICSAECLTNSKWSHDKTCQSELSIIRSWGPIIRSWGITLAGMFFLTYIIAYRTSNSPRANCRSPRANYRSPRANCGQFWLAGFVMWPFTIG